MTPQHDTKPTNGQWRLLVLDRGDDPKWLLATIAEPEDIRPALIEVSGRYAGWQGITEWAAARLGQPAELIPVHGPLAWTLRPARRQPGEGA